MSVHLRELADVVDYQPTQLVFRQALELDEYEQLLQALGAITKGHQWWVGDALVFGENRFGEDTFSQAAEALGLEPHTMVNWRWVASAVEPDRRRDEPMTWSHHAEVARLDPGQQDKALALAVEHGWTVRQLRDYVSIEWPRRPDDPPAPPAPVSAADEQQIARRIESIGLALENVRELPDPAARYHEHVEYGDVIFLFNLAIQLTRRR